VYSGADDQPAATPGEFFVGRQRRVPEPVSVLLGGFLGPFPYPARLDDDVVFVLLPIDLDGAEPE
jgi:hypothetical protein